MHFQILQKCKQQTNFLVTLTTLNIISLIFWYQLYNYSRLFTFAEL